MCFRPVGLSKNIFAHLLAIFLSSYYCCISNAQSDMDLTQKWFNESIYNPGATGNGFSTGVFLHGRIQWAGLEGAPSTQVVSVDTYVEDINSAFGAVFSKDQIGYLGSFSVKAAYAYYIPIGQKSTIAGGLSAGLLNKNKNIQPGMAAQDNDPFIAYNSVNRFSQDFDFGIEYKGSFKAGVSIRHLGTNSEIKQDPNIWAYLNTRINISRNASVEPCLSYTFRGDISRYEGGMIFYFSKTSQRNAFSDKFRIGVMYRSVGQLAVLAGIALNTKLQLGYSFDYGLNELSGISKAGTHEIFLGWHLNRIFYKEFVCPAYRGSPDYGKKRR